MAPKANIVRFEDETTSNTASSRPDRSLGDAQHHRPIVIKQHPEKTSELKFKLRIRRRNMAMRQGDFALLQWLNTYVFLIRANGEHCSACTQLARRGHGDAVGYVEERRQRPQNCPI